MSNALFFTYGYLVVAVGTGLLAMAAGAVGCLTVLKGQSLIGDAIGHSSFPGIVLAFMLAQSRNPIILMAGALAAGSLAFVLIQAVHRQGALSLDSVLAVVLSSFFGLGMVLKSHIQGHAAYSGASQSGLQNYIFGQAAYMMKSDNALILAIAVAVLLLLVIFYKELKVFIFDEGYAATIGVHRRAMYALMMVCAMSVIAAGLKVVGAILISSLLIVPAITALQWSDVFHRVLLIAAAVGGISALVGTYISTVVEGMSTGPTIIVIMSLMAFASLVFGPRGMVAAYRKRRELP